MASAHDDNPDWRAADGSPEEEPQPLGSSLESEGPPVMPHVKRIEMMEIHEEDDEEEATQIAPGDFEHKLQAVRDSLAT